MNAVVSTIKQWNFLSILTELFLIKGKENMKFQYCITRTCLPNAKEDISSSRPTKLVLCQKMYKNMRMFDDYLIRIVKRYKKKRVQWTLCYGGLQSENSKIVKAESNWRINSIINLIVIRDCVL